MGFSLLILFTFLSSSRVWSVPRDSGTRYIMDIVIIECNNVILYEKYNSSITFFIFKRIYLLEQYIDAACERSLRRCHDGWDIVKGAGRIREKKIAILCTYNYYVLYKNIIKYCVYIYILDSINLLFFINNTNRGMNR